MTSEESRDQCSHAREQCCSYEWRWVLLLAYHKAGQNDHMLWDLCLCFEITRHVCLQSVIITLSPGLYIHGCLWASEGGWFSIRILSSYWCIQQNLTPLLGVTFVSFCACYDCILCLGSVLCYDVMASWEVRQGLSCCLSHQVDFYNYQEKFLRSSSWREMPSETSWYKEGVWGNQKQSEWWFEPILCEDIDVVKWQFFSLWCDANGVIIILI